MGAGHASTSIGYAVGLKEAMRRARRGRQGRRGHRRRRDDRRRRVRGGPPGRRPGHADGRDPQRQRDVDRAERRRAVALLQPRPARPGAVEGARGRGGEAHAAAGRHRRGVRAPRPAGQGVDQGACGSRGCGGRSSTGPTSASSTATTCARSARRCARRSRPSGRSSSTSPRSRARASRPPRRAAWRAWRSGMPPSRSRSPTGGPPPPSKPKAAGAAAVHAGVRRGDGARVQARPARRRHHRRDELRHRALDPAEGDARPLLRRRHRRAAGDPVRLRPRAPGHAPGRRDLLDVPAARVRPDRPRRLPAEPAGGVRAWTAPASSATTARPTTARSTSPTCGRCPTSC